jgi:hypothetical protein
MIETAPSGAYVEDWRLLPESRAFAAHLTKRDAAAATCLYVAGEHVIYARNRTVDLPSDKSLVELASVLNTNAAAWKRRVHGALERRAIGSEDADQDSCRFWQLSETDRGFTAVKPDRLKLVAKSARQANAY